VSQGLVTIQEFEQRFKAAFGAADAYTATQPQGSMAEIQAKISEMRNAAFQNDFCPWAKGNKSRLPTQVTSTPHFAPMINQVCPNF
jgi:hypothetical protein